MTRQKAPRIATLMNVALISTLATRHHYLQTMTLAMEETRKAMKALLRALPMSRRRIVRALCNRTTCTRSPTQLSIRTILLRRDLLTFARLLTLFCTVFVAILCAKSNSNRQRLPQPTSSRRYRRTVPTGRDGRPRHAATILQSSIDRHKCKECRGRGSDTVTCAITLAHDTLGTGLVKRFFLTLLIRPFSVILRL